MYRARVLNINEEGSTADVLFIDFGNKDTCTEFYEMGRDLLDLPAGARSVKLLVNSGIEETRENWEKLEEKLFGSELEVDFLLIFNFIQD